MGDLHTVAVGQEDGVGGLAVDVQLQLIGRAVADPHRSRAAPPLEVLQGFLDQVRGAVHSVHDLQRPRRITGLLGRPVPQPAAERGRLFDIAQAQQRVDGERAVPDPGVPVVPVAFPADLLGQPGGRRRHRRPGRRVGQQLQRDRRPVHHLPPPAGIARPGQPAAPEPRRVLGHLLGFPRRDQARRPPHRLQHHAADLALAQGTRPAQPVTDALQRDPRSRQRGPLGRDAVQGQLQILGGEHHAVLGDVQRVRLAAVVEPRLDLDREPHDPADHADVAHQPVPAGRRALDDRHEVLHLADPVRGHEPGDQDRGIREVQLPAHVVVAVGRDPVEAAALGIEQGREHARRVESGAAEPVQHAIGADQRRRLQVADEPVIANIRVTSQRFPPSEAEVSVPGRLRSLGRILHPGDALMIAVRAVRHITRRV